MEPDMLDCDGVMRQLWDYLDGELTDDRMAAIAAHIEVCERCYPQYEFERAFLTAVANAKRSGAVQPGLRDRIMNALMNAGLQRGA